MRYLWFTIRLQFKENIEWLAWKAAFALPRKVALLAFVRVAAASGQGPSDITYEGAYKAWEEGAGR